MAQMKYSKIKVTVDSVAGKCPLGNTRGREFFIERTTPAGMCLSAFKFLILNSFMVIFFTYRYNILNFLSESFTWLARQ